MANLTIKERLKALAAYVKTEEFAEEVRSWPADLAYYFDFEACETHNKRLADQSFYPIMEADKCAMIGLLNVTTAKLEYVQPVTGSKRKARYSVVLSDESACFNIAA